MRRIVLNVPDDFDELVKNHLGGLAPDADAITDDERRAFIAALLAAIADGLEAPDVARGLVELNSHDLQPHH
jgi:hypothetical protein